MTASTVSGRLPSRPLPTARTTSASSALPIAVFVACCFLPYPAIAVGNVTGLQLGQVLALVMTATLLVGRGLPVRQVVVAVALYVPLLVSGLHAIGTDGAPYADIVAKNLVVVPLAAVALVPAGIVLADRGLRSTLLGVSMAILFHAAIGTVQVAAFARGDFPLLGLYRNPSFAPMVEAAPIYAQVVKRPFGLFPEPSAMAASLGPWLVVALGVLLDPRHRPRLSRPRLWLLVAATGTGLYLVVASRSGFSLALAAAAALLTLPALRHGATRAFHVPNLALVSLLTVGGVFLVFVTLQQLGDRLNYTENTSWQLRMRSLSLGLAPLDDDLATLVFGVGPAQSSVLLQTEFSGVQIPGTESEIVAVWSITVRYLVETGLLGVAALGLAGAMALRAILLSSARLIGVTALLVWLLGVTLSTSYLPLSPIWLFLGTLLVWDRVFVAGPAHPGG